MMTCKYSTKARQACAAAASVLSLIALSLVGVLALAGTAQAAATSVPLGSADSFAVLAATTVTNTGPSVIQGDVGVSPGTAVTGFPPGTVMGTIHAADAVAGQAQSDLTNAYNIAAGEPSSETISADLGGRTLTTGVYSSATSLGLTGTLTLDAQGDPHAVFVFQAGSTLCRVPGLMEALIPRKDESHGSTEEVPRGASGASDPVGG